MFFKILKGLLIVFVLSGTDYSARAEDQLVFSTAENVLMGKVAENVLRQAYQSLGITISVVGYPALRALVNADEGIVDGELIRVKGLEADYKNLIMIPVPLTTMEGVAFTKNPDIRIKGFDSLKPFSIAFRRGIKFAEKGTDGMNRTVLDTLEHAFLLLTKDRVDVVISTRLTGLVLINRLRYQGIRTLEPPLVRTYLYHYLHQKHKALVPMITTSLQQMQNEGKITREKERVIRELLKSSQVEHGH